MLWVKAEDEVLKEKVWLCLDGANVEVFEKIEVDPFSRVCNIRKGKVFEIGPYHFKVIGEVAYTRAYPLKFK